MTIGASVVLALLVVLLTLVTLVQMFYLESLRLRTRDNESFQFFRDQLERALGVEDENGALTFSVIKHTMLAFLGVTSFLVASQEFQFGIPAVAEACLIAWLAMMLTSYVAPQILYRRTSCRWLVGFIPILRILILASRPLTALLGFMDSLAALGDRQKEAPDASENIEAFIEAGTEEGLIEEENRALIQSAATFAAKRVREVMTPRPNIVAIAAEASLDDLRRLLINEQYSRIPVFEGTIDNVVGFVHVRDTLDPHSPTETGQTKRVVRDVMREIALVPETKEVGELMPEMQSHGSHMAIVVDEYGNTAGLVTLEDMVEELVGEIRDEHEPASDAEQQPDGSFIVSGSYDVDHLREMVDFKAPEDTESTTVGGLVTEWLGRVPGLGESVTQAGIRLEVLAASERRVERVRVSRAMEGSAAGQGE